jgi:hypothetical protein
LIGDPTTYDLLSRLPPLVFRLEIEMVLMALVIITLIVKASVI